MLAIRFKRIGRKHQPAFRIVVAEKRSKRDGRSVDDIGFYNPITKEFGIKKERLEYWLSVGAKPTPSVHNLLVNHKLITAPKIRIKTKDKKENTQASAPENSQENLVENKENPEQTAN
jgi:small subunit ribosomal protein S16